MKIIAFTFFSLLLTSCGVSLQDVLVGQWTETSTDGKSVILHTFEAGGSVAFQQYLDGTPTPSLEGTWSVSGETLTVVAEGDTVVIVVSELQEDSFTATRENTTAGSGVKGPNTWVRGHNTPTPTP